MAEGLPDNREAQEILRTGSDPAREGGEGGGGKDPRRRRWSRILGAVLVVVVLLVFLRLVTSPSRVPKRAAIIPPPPQEVRSTTRGGFGATPYYAHELAEQEKAKAKASLLAGTVYIPPPVVSRAKKRHSSAASAVLAGAIPPPSAPSSSGTADTVLAGAAPVPTATAGVTRELRSLGIPEGARRLPSPTVVLVSLPKGAGAARPRLSRGGSRPVRAAPPLPIRTGGIYYAVTETALDSDVPGPALAEIASGRAQGWKFLGGFHRDHGLLVVRFDRAVSPGGRTVGVTAYAVDPRTSLAAVRTSVDYHTFSRWAGLIAADFLAGFGQAVAQAGSVTTYGYGAGGTGTITVNPARTAGAEAEIAAGNVGQVLAQEAQQNFNRAPTVRLAPGVGIGILVTSVSPPPSGAGPSGAGPSGAGPSGAGAGGSRSGENMP